MTRRTITTPDGLWQLSTHGNGQVEIEGPHGRQTATINADELGVDVCPDERGKGWEGDMARFRRIPTAVLRAALGMLDLSCD